MMGGGPQCYIPSFVEIGQPVLEKKIFESFLPYMGVAAILVIIVIDYITYSYMDKVVFNLIDYIAM